jgi:hypothetical protein
MLISRFYCRIQAILHLRSVIQKILHLRLSNLKDFDQGDWIQNIFDLCVSWTKCKILWSKGGRIQNILDQGRQNAKSFAFGAWFVPWFVPDCITGPDRPSDFSWFVVVPWQLTHSRWKLTLTNTIQRILHLKRYNAKDLVQNTKILHLKQLIQKILIEAVEIQNTLDQGRRNILHLRSVCWLLCVCRLLCADS